MVKVSGEMENMGSILESPGSLPVLSPAPLVSLDMGPISRELPGMGRDITFFRKSESFVKKKKKKME